MTTVCYRLPANVPSTLASELTVNNSARQIRLAQLGPFDGLPARPRPSVRYQLAISVNEMDDILILTRTRWQLRRAVATLRQMLGELDLELHREKRFIGRTSTGFDFLGYRFQSGRRLRPAKQSLERLLTRSRRLYEQGATRAQLWRYVERWVEWLWGGLGRIVSRKGGRRTYWVYILKRLAIPKAVRPRRDTPR